jgi:TIR domain-containing protein
MTTPLEKRSVFVSYARHDLNQVQPLVVALEQHGFDVRWDQKIYTGRWDEKVDAWLDRVDHVIAFLTENAVLSRHVLVEVRRAREQGKLVPLRIGDFRVPHAFDAEICLIQTYTFQTAISVVEAEGFEQVCRACGASDEDAPRPADRRREVADHLGHLSKAQQSHVLVAFAIAVAVLEHTPLAQIQLTANDLSRLLWSAVSEQAEANTDRRRDDASLLRWQNSLTPRSERLNAIGAEVYQEPHQRLKIDQDCCRFKDPDRASALLLYVWQELDQLQQPLIEWFDHLADTARPDTRMRLGLALGRVAQATFPSVFDRILRRWALDEHQTRREVADIALSVASVAAGAGDAIKRIIDDWSRNTNSPRSMRAAIELSCGYTGMRIPRLSIETLKTVARGGGRDLELVTLLKTATRQLLLTAVEADDSTLFDLPQLIEDLAAWVENRRTGDVDRLPMFLFLTTIEDLPLHKPDGVAGVLSLADIVADDRTQRSFVRVLSSALRDPGTGEIEPREHARAILRRWVEDQRVQKHDPDPVLALVRALLVHNADVRDKDRIVFLLRTAYSPAQLGLG